MNTTPTTSGMSGTLRIEPSTRSVRDVVAWYLPGSDPQAWLAAMGQMGVAMDSLRVMVLPVSAQDRSPRGIVVTALDHRPLSRPQVMCEAYGVEAGVLYLPTHARLLPAVSAEECRGLILAPAAVFHPIAGFIFFEQRDLLSAFDLIERAQPHEQTWDAAVPGVALNPHLLAVMPDEVPTLEQLDRDLRDDIGTQPLKDLPAPKDEPKDTTLGSAGKAVARGFLSALRAVGKALSGRNQKPAKDGDNPQTGQTSPAAGTGGKAGLGGVVTGFFGLMATWADVAIEKLSPSTRQRELDRLERMLAENPAEALKFAIPFGNVEHRGIAPPSNQLSARNTNFSLSDLGGGRPLDAWDVPWEQQQSLMKRYRELALAESRMGRHRRAAYIFATLLGDLDAAAKALIEGGFYREAATVYRDRLKRPEAAAKCLEQGGLLLEAARLYIEFERWLEVARIYRKLGRDEDACGYVRREVNRLRDSDDYTAAAFLLENDLADITAAVDMLRLGFDDSRQRHTCFQRLLDIFGRLGHHRDTKTFVSEAVRNLRDMNDACHIAQHLGQTVTNYPDRATAQVMSETVLTLVSDRLLTATQSEADRLAATVALLAPEDRLLLRDSQAYTRQRKPAVAPRPLLPRRDGNVIREVKAFQLPATADWMVGASVGRLMYIAAWTSSGLTLMRCDSTGETEVVAWQPGALLPGGAENVYRVSVHVGQHESEDVLIAPISPRWKPQYFAARDTVPGLGCGSCPWLPPFPETLAICTSAPGVVWTLTHPQHDELALNAYSREGTLLNSVSLDMSEVAPQEAAAPKLYARPRMTVLAWGERLFLHRQDESPRTIDLGRSIRDMVGTAPFARSRFVVTHDAGATIVWARDTHQWCNHLAADMPSPVAAFTRNSGLLVLASAGECRIWSTARDELTLLQIIKWDELKRRQPVAVLPIDPADDFVVIFQSGEAVHYHVEPPHGARH